MIRDWVYEQDQVMETKHMILQIRDYGSDGEVKHALNVCLYSRSTTTVDYRPVMSIRYAYESHTNSCTEHAETFQCVVHHIVVLNFSG